MLVHTLHTGTHKVRGESRWRENVRRLGQILTFFLSKGKPKKKKLFCTLLTFIFFALLYFVICHFPSKKKFNFIIILFYSRADVSLSVVDCHRSRLQCTNYSNIILWMIWVNFNGYYLWNGVHRCCCYLGGLFFLFLSFFFCIHFIFISPIGIFSSTWLFDTRLSNMPPPLCSIFSTFFDKKQENRNGNFQIRHTPYLDSVAGVFLASQAYCYWFQNKLYEMTFHVIVDLTFYWAIIDWFLHRSVPKN